MKLMSFIMKTLLKFKCLNTRCFINIINRFFLKKLFFEFKLNKYKVLIILREIDFNKHFINE